MEQTRTRRDKPLNWGTPEFWLERAEQAKAMADQFADPDARAAMARVAERYYRMAEHATGTREPT
jgi:hypothetical protein